MLRYGLLLLVIVGLAVPALARQTAHIELQIREHGQSLEGVEVAIFMSCDKLVGQTDAEGRVSLESDCGGRQYWIEINGERIGQLYEADRDVKTIDLESVTFIEWQGGR
jgi:hypothetical protein